MQPAYSVIFFTTFSGLGYGLLVLLGLMGGTGLIPADRGFGLAAFGLAFVTVTLGLFASTLHLGHPERAWRAFGEWRTSWLSREGVVAVVTYLPTGGFALHRTKALWCTNSPPRAPSTKKSTICWKKKNAYLMMRLPRGERAGSPNWKTSNSWNSSVLVCHSAG